MRNLKTQIDDFVINSNERMLAVVRQSISEVVEEAQTPVAKGGRMRVKTGFLRASGIATLNTLPSGQSKGDPKGSYTWKGESINVVLAQIKIGDVFFFGWTARYAKIREVYDGFLETSLQNWQSHVDKATAFFRNKDAK
jgi:hypothetical protein